MRVQMQTTKLPEAIDHVYLDKMSDWEKYQFIMEAYFTTSAKSFPFLVSPMIINFVKQLAALSSYSLRTYVGKLRTINRNQHDLVANYMPYICYLLSAICLNKMCLI